MKNIINTWYKVDTCCNDVVGIFNGCGSYMINGEYCCGGCGRIRYEYYDKKLIKNKITKL